MSAYQETRDVERVAQQELLPWLLMKCDVVEATDHSEFLQKVVGDYVVSQLTSTYGIELKAEQDSTTGNLFLETWSNLARLTPGWMVTSRADWLFYYFTDVRVLYVINFDILRLWAFGSDEEKAHIYEWPEKRQNRYDQKNDTWGRCVPIKVLQESGVPFKRYTAEDRNLPMLG